MFTEEFDLIVVGAGHAGCEAALAGARMGQRTLLLTLNLDSVAMMPCNPAIGGTGKGHLVRELDALGGEMGRAIDDTFIQSRMLNTGKGPAVYSLRAQADKMAYKARMRAAVENQPGLTLRQGEVRRLIVENGEIRGVETATGSKIGCRAAVLCTGVYLKSRIIIGQCSWEGGPQGLIAATGLTQSLLDNGFSIRRFKTGTPARVDMRTVDFSKMTPQEGDSPIVPFSFLTDAAPLKNRALCYLTYTTPETHEIIRENLHLSPMYSGEIKGTGARYCPSIEDKVVRFADKERHPIFMEPEGLNTVEWYVQGMSSSLPEDVQRRMYRSVPGLEHAELMRLAYAIEYDCIDSTQLDASLSFKEIPGLYGAGQFNGTSGYEEAAAQGLIAGMNAALYVKGKPPVILTRDSSYIGTLIDDLVTKGTNEPYRMMTSRSEYRLLLRQDNADSRLSAIGHSAGLLSDAAYGRYLKKAALIKAEKERLMKTVVPPSETINSILASVGEPPIKTGVRISDLLRRPGITYEMLALVDEERKPLPANVVFTVQTELKYEGYIKKQLAEAARFEKLEKKLLPSDIDYQKITGLSTEAVQKLTLHRPLSIGAASRISGVSPADISVLLIYLDLKRRGGEQEISHG